MKTPQEFFAKYDNMAVDYDGAYQVQCVDGFKVFCEWAGIPVKATPNNWANGYWLYRDQLGYYNWFEYITDVNELRQGDWCIWNQGSSCPLSHIAMYWKGVNGTTAQFFGENQDGKRFFCLANVKKDIMGALRWKGWSQDTSYKMKGCDVSQWNSLTTDISSYDYVIIRATWGTNLDPVANDWRLKCEREGKPYGVYCYSYALDNIGAREEAEFICNAIDGWNVRMGVWYDMEIDDYKTSHGFVSAEQWTSACDTFCERVQQRGYYTGIYSSESYFSSHIKTNRWDKWVASWGTNDGTIQRDTSSMGTMLQYTSNGGLDKDIAYCELDHYKSFPVVQEPIEEPIEQEPVEDKDDSQTGSNEVIEVPQVQEGSIFEMSNRTYDLWKFIASIFFPLAATLYVTLADTWGWNYTKEIVATVTAIITFINGVLAYSSIEYKKKGGTQ